jgi:hypothetical protein
MAEVLNVPVDNETPVNDQLTAHDQDMINKAEGKTSPPEGEKLLAGKYKDEPALDKGTLELLTKLYGSKEEGYKALESLLGKPKTEDGKTPLPTIKEPNKAADKPLEIKTAEDVLKQAGLNLADFSKEFMDKGQLSEDSYTKLAAKGYSKEIVDDWIDGQKAKVELQRIEGEKIVSEVHTVVGGKESYEVMVQWASQNLTQDEIKVLNEGLLGDMAHAKIAAEMLKQKYTAVNGKNPLLYMGTSPSTSADIFRSKAELTAAMKDPRYQKDEAYRNDVVLKLGRSKILG